MFGLCTTASSPKGERRLEKAILYFYWCHALENLSSITPKHWRVVRVNSRIRPGRISRIEEGGTRPFAVYDIISGAP